MTQADGDHGVLVGFVGLVLSGEMTGQGIGPDIFGTRAERQGEDESAEQEGPARLPGTEPLRIADVSEVLVVRPDENGVLGSLQPVPPLLEGHVDGQKFPVSHVIIPLGRGESSGQEGDRVDELVLLRALGKHGSDAYIRRIHLYDELLAGIGEDEHRSRGEEGLECGENGFCLWGPGEGAEGGG